MKFSVVIPTRNRIHTLGYTLRTCLAQDHDDYEIIVANNSDPDKRDRVTWLCERMNSHRRIRYHEYPSSEVASLPASWEYALSLATGDYVTILGDDDGLMPFCLAMASQWFTQVPTQELLTWRRGFYVWPDGAVEQDRNYLFVPMGGQTGQIDSRAAIAAVANFEAPWDRLPMIYNSFVRRDLLNTWRAKGSPLFASPHADIYSGFALAYLSGRFGYCPVPLTVSGLSGSSCGVATTQLHGEHDAAREFLRLSPMDSWHPSTPRLLCDPAFVADAFYQARDKVFPDAKLHLYTPVLAQKCAAALPHNYPGDRSEALRLAFPTDDLSHIPPCFPRRNAPEQRGWLGSGLGIFAEDYGIVDIAGAVELSAKLCGWRRPRPRSSVFQMCDICPGHMQEPCLDNAGNRPQTACFRRRQTQRLDKIILSRGNMVDYECS